MVRNEGSFAVLKWFCQLQNEFQQHGREMEVVPFWRVVEAKYRCFSQDRLVLALVQFCGTWTERSLISSIPCSCAWSLISIESDLRGKKKKKRQEVQLLVELSVLFGAEIGVCC